MEKRHLVKIIGYLVYCLVVVLVGKYEQAQGYDWWVIWTLGIVILALLCMSAGGLLSKGSYVNDSMRFRQYQKYNSNYGGIGEIVFYILLMLPLIYNMMQLVVMFILFDGRGCVKKT